MKLFKRISNSFLNMGIAAKQFIFLYAITLTLFSALSMVVLNEMNKVFRQQTEGSSQQIVGRTREFLDIYIDNIKNIVLMLSNQTDLFKQENREHTLKLLTEYARNNPSSVSLIYVVNADRQVYCSRQTIFEIYGNTELERIYNSSISQKGRIVWTEPYYSRVAGGNTIAFSLGILDDNRKEVGVVVVEIRLDTLLQKLQELLESEKGIMFILSPYGEPVVYDTVEQLRQLTVKGNINLTDRRILNEMQQLPFGVSYPAIFNNSKVVVKSAATILGWQLFLVVDSSNYFRMLHRFYKYIQLAGVIWVIILLLASLLISRYFTSSIRKLTAWMDNVKNLQDLPSIKVHRRDEVGRLAESYNEMTARIKRLAGELKLAEAGKKEYELKMLQSQISPHFLYNTLACIENMAKLQILDEVRDTISSLVGLLTYSFDKRSDIVTLEEELEGLGMYIDIQKMRYGDIFDLVLDIPEEAKTCSIPKLTLQPIVENSIFHGITCVDRKGCILIKAKRKKDIWKIYVADNGAGMEKTQCKRILMDSMVQRQGHKFNSIGIKNVNERLKLYYGEKFGLTIASRPEKGTVVYIKLPG